MSIVRRLLAVGLVAVAAPALAGPPYLTDDPVPTDSRHWEIYAFTAGEGGSADFDDDIGLDLNYGAVKGIQLTATLPLSFSHERGEGWRGGTGDVELAVKYRFLDDEKHGFSAAIFPRVFLPTASHSPGDRLRLLLPIWLGKDFAGGTSLFGGGGYTVNPGAGQRDFWISGLAVTRQVGKGLQLGSEVYHRGSEAKAGHAFTGLNLGLTWQVTPHWSLLASGGPGVQNAHDEGQYAFYLALGATY